jgi:DNA-binding NtrC family response regulator
VIDDEASIRLLCRVNLELEGFAVLEAGTLGEARHRLAEEPVEVVLLDLHIGNQSGRDLLEELLDADPPIPVALVTGSTDPESASGAGAAAVLPKPFTITELVETVRTLAGSRAPAR